MSVRMRHTSRHTANRRSHHRVQTGSFQICAECKAPKLSHRVCMSCGIYKKNSLINVNKKAEKIEKKNKKRKTEVHEHKEENKKEE